MSVHNDNILLTETAVRKSGCYKRLNMAHPTVIVYRYKTTFFLSFIKASKKQYTTLSLSA